MNRIEAALIRLRGELDQLRLDWALIGGLAVSARAEPRTTRDIDVAIVVAEDRQAEGIVRALQARDYLTREGGIIEQTAANRLATVRLESPANDTAGIVVDLMFASSGIEPEVVGASDPVEIFPGVTLPVASRGHLIALKVLASGPGRPQDDSDALALIAMADERDLAQARQAIDLIERRGYARGKDLLLHLRSLLEGARTP